MIARSNRFHGYSSLSFVQRHGQTVRGPLLSLRYVLNDRRKSWRLAVVVSRKVSKSAVARNRIRRRIYEVVRLNEPNIVGPYDFVFVVFSPQLTDVESEKLATMIVELLRRAGVINSQTSGSRPSSHAIVKNKED